MLAVAPGAAPAATPAMRIAPVLMDEALARQLAEHTSDEEVIGLEPFLWRPAIGALLNDENAPYKRALAAAALAKGLLDPKRSATSTRLLDGRTGELVDAVVHLIGHAKRLQQGWLAWDKGEDYDPQLRKKLVVCADDAQKMRHNCLSALALFLGDSATASAPGRRVDGPQAAEFVPPAPRLPSARPHKLKLKMLTATTRTRARAARTRRRRARRARRARARRRRRRRRRPPPLRAHAGRVDDAADGRPHDDVAPAEPRASRAADKLYRERGGEGAGRRERQAHSRRRGRDGARGAVQVTSSRRRASTSRRSARTARAPTARSARSRTAVDRVARRRRRRRRARAGRAAQRPLRRRRGSATGPSRAYDPHIPDTAPRALAAPAARARARARRTRRRATRS